MVDIMNNIQEKVKEIKKMAECAIYGIDNHKVHYLPDDGSFNNVINGMHNAQSKDKLREVYQEYIHIAIANGYSDGQIIAGIMQNEDQNNKFNVEIDAVIESLIQIKSPINLGYNKVEEPKKVEESKKSEEPKKVEEPKKAEEPKKSEEPKKVEIDNQQPVQQGVAAHTEGAFNISNFIKQPPVMNQQPIINQQQQQQQPEKPKAVFPHQICGLSDEEIVAEVAKHFKVMETLPAYALYDLCKNKNLAQKMKEYNCKQRANNPFLTQVDINEYINDPETLEKFKLCFTLPCNEKKKVIVVLFNPVAVPNKNGLVEYPLNIIKCDRPVATKKKAS